MGMGAAIGEIRVPGSAKGASRSAIKGVLSDVSAARVNLGLKKAVTAGKLTQHGDSFKVVKKKKSAPARAAPAKKAAPRKRAPAKKAAPKKKVTKKKAAPKRKPAAKKAAPKKKAPAAKKAAPKKKASKKKSTKKKK